MIKANELRIGNRVYTWDTDYDFGPGNQFEEVVQEIRERVVEFKTSHAAYYEIEPIPLTPEWLERMGFVKDKDQPLEPIASDYTLSVNVPGHNANDICASVLHKSTEHRTAGTRAYYTVNDHWGSRDIQYVHQLQNLYFALTGEEIIIV